MVFILGVVAVAFLIILGGITVIVGLVSFVRDLFQPCDTKK